MKLIKKHRCYIFEELFFRIVDIGGKNNQYLQFALHAFYKDVEETKEATFLWNPVNWSNINTTMRCNDNAFVFNIILGYNTAFL